jgi:hypothetical protein
MFFYFFFLKNSFKDEAIILKSQNYNFIKYLIKLLKINVFKLQVLKE